MNTDSSKIDFERIRELYGAMNRIVLGGVFLLIVLGMILKDHLEIYLVITWVSVTFFLYVPRVYLAWLFKSKTHSGEINSSNVQVWETYWILSTVPVLASYTALLFFPLTEEALLAVAILLLILSSGSTMTYATSMKTIIISYCVIYIPLTARFFMVGESIFDILGFAFIATFVIFLSYALSLNRNLVENIKLKIDSEHISLKDPLTSLLNRRGLEYYLDELTPQLAKNGESYGIILFDIDHFKKYNDTFGHTSGDDLLVKVSRLIETEIKERDLVVRYGGEEFLIVLANSDIKRLKKFADNILKKIRENCNVTISAGLAMSASDLNFEELFKVADDALYLAKGAGRDQYKVALAKTTGSDQAKSLIK